MKATYRELNFSAHQVKIKIEGFRIDKLLDSAMKAGIYLRDVRHISPLAATCRIGAGDLESFKKLAKSLYRITELEHKGPQYKLKRFYAEPLRILGIFVVCALVISQSFFVKTIEISGYRAIPEMVLREVLAEAGVEEGSFRPHIDWDAAEELLFDSLPQITWVQLVYDGRKVLLNISESGDSGEEIPEEKKGYCNIVAAESGYIEKINAYRGLALVEEGDFVNKGDVLISGYVPIEPNVYDKDYPKYYYVRATGDVTAKAPYRLKFNQERYVSGNEETADLVANKREKTDEEVEKKLQQQLRLWIKENLPENAEILTKNLNFLYKESIIEIGVTLEVRREIGKEQEIVIGQKSTDQSGY